MHTPSILAVLCAGLLASAAPSRPSPRQSDNPFLNKNYYAPSHYANEIAETIAAFKARDDTLNAARAKTVQSIGTFTWIANVASLPMINTAISEARAAKSATGKDQIVGLVLYDIPDRDCSGGDASGEFSSADDGLNKYKTTFVDPYAAALASATDLTFAIVVEPDAVGNIVTNQAIAFCANATPVYEAGIAYAISELQMDHVALYLDAAHGGWLGWPATLPEAAAELAKIIGMAAALKPKAKVRGFSTNVSGFNAYVAITPPAYTDGSSSYDELHYTENLTPYLTNLSLPAQFIIDQGRSGLQDTRTSWGDWCNVLEGFGIRPTTVTNSSAVDSIVWVKPGGESDGPCGPTINGTTAPAAGVWWEAYAEQLVELANPPLVPTY